MTKSPPLPPGGGAPTFPPCPVPPPPTLISAPMLHALPLPPAQPLECRDAKGRFAPGSPGRPPGTRNRTTLAMEAMMEGQWEALTKTAIQMALRGDSTALKLCIDRLAPIRRGSSVTIPDFPAVAAIADVPKAQAALLAAVAAGHLSADEATPLSALLAAYVTAVDVVDTAAEVAEIKKLQEEARGTTGRY